MAKKFNERFRKGTLGFKIVWLSIVYVFLFVALLSPFILIEGASKVLAIILLSVLTVAYVFILLLYIWDWIKAKYQIEDKK